MTDFHRTVMGQRLIEHTLPELVRQVSRLAAAVDRLADLQERAGRQPETENEDDPEGTNPPPRG
jgi:hypothetical protein